MQMVQAVTAVFRAWPKGRQAVTERAKALLSAGHLVLEGECESCSKLRDGFMALAQTLGWVCQSGGKPVELLISFGQLASQLATDSALKLL